MKTIPLSQGLVALVDDADHEELSKYRWSAQKSHRVFYAVRDVRVDGKVRKLRMHRVIMGDAAIGLHVDHRDGDGLNNQRSNLRACTHAENLHNQGAKNTNTTGFKGVSFQKKSSINPYKAEICINGPRKYLGCYPTPELAYAAYCAAAIEFHGEFARLA